MIKLLITILFVSFLFLFPSYAQAQNNNGKITGKIIDFLLRTPVDYATITFSLSGSQKVITGTTADTTDAFILQGIEPGSYSLSVEFIGYKVRVIPNLVLTKQNAIVEAKDLKALSNKL